MTNWLLFGILVVSILRLVLNLKQDRDVCMMNVQAAERQREWQAFLKMNDDNLLAMRREEFKLLTRLAQDGKIADDLVAQLRVAILAEEAKHG